ARGRPAAAGWAGAPRLAGPRGGPRPVVRSNAATRVSPRPPARSACARVPEGRAPPVPADLNSPYALQQLTFRIDHATNADVARLETGLARFPSVVGVTLQDSSDMGG